MRALVAPVVVGLAPILVLALLIIGPSLGLVKWQPPVLWTSQFGTAGPDAGPFVQNGITAMSTDSSGVYTAGFVGYLASGGSSSYLFLSKYDFTGRQVWTQHFGKPDSGGIAGISTGADGVYVAALVNLTTFVRKYDLSGNAVWNSQLGNLSYRIASISVGSTGVYMGGSAPTGPIVRKYDFNGNMVWNRTVSSDIGKLVVYSGSSGVYVAFSQNVYGPDSHTFVSKYDTNGTLQWSRSFDSPPVFICNCEPTSVSGDASGLYLAGSTIDSLFVRKYDWTGNVLWTVRPGYSASLVSSSANPSGVYLAGNNGFVIKYDSNGNQVWSTLVQQTPAAISVGQNGVYVGGTNGYAFIEELSQSSSLILFGVNPPFSFGLATLLGGLVALSLLWLRRRWRKKIRPPSMALRRGPTNPSTNTKF